VFNQEIQQLGNFPIVNYIVKTYGKIKQAQTRK